MVSGVIAKIADKPWNNKVMYSIVLANDNTYYGFGTYKPNAQVGDFVEFQADKNEKGYWQGNKDTFKKVAQAAEQAIQNVPAKLIRTIAPGKDDYWLNKEKRDLENDHLRSLGAARNTAIEWVKFLIAQEALPVPKTIAKREDSLNAVLDDYTRLFMSGTIPEKVVEEDAPKAPKEAKVKVSEAPVSEPTDESWS